MAYCQREVAKVALVKCAGCGAMIHLGGQTQCGCGAIVRRCVDCSNYEAAQEYCNSLLTEVDPREAINPSRLSVSASCPRYHYLSHAA
jgi:hypothetical protein